MNVTDHLTDLSRSDAGIDLEAFRWGGSTEPELLLLEGAARGDDEAVMVALDAGADPDAVGTAGPGTALLLAAARGHLPVVDRLLRAGASLDLGDETKLVTALDGATGLATALPVFVPDAALGLAALGRHLDVVARIDAETAARAVVGGR